MIKKYTVPFSSALGIFLIVLLFFATDITSAFPLVSFGKKKEKEPVEQALQEIPIEITETCLASKYNVGYQRSNGTFKRIKNSRTLVDCNDETKKSVRILPSNKHKNNIVVDLKDARDGVTEYKLSSIQFRLDWKGKNDKSKVWIRISEDRKEWSDVDTAFPIERNQEILVEVSQSLPEARFVQIIWTKIKGYKKVRLHETKIFEDVDSQYNQYPYHPGHMIVRYEGDLDTSAFTQEVGRVTGLEDVQAILLSESIYLVSSVHLRTDAISSFQAHFASLSTEEQEDVLDQNTITALERIAQINGVSYAEPDYRVQATDFDPPPNDMYYQNQWALHNTGQTGGTPDADVDIPEAWEFEQGDNSIVIAVVDSGVDYTHPDLNDNILRSGGAVIGYDFVNNDSDPMDDYGHGTHCAGIIAAETDNSLGIAGICTDCKILPVKFLNNRGSGWNSDAVLALQYAVDHGADVISNSWGGPAMSYAMQDVINEAYDQNIVVIAAAGNSSSSAFMYPASLDHVISVSATDHTDTFASYSNFGIRIDISAPGTNILSTLLPGAYLSSTCNDANFGSASDGYALCSGTSMAAPQVAGIAALIKAQNSNMTSPVLYERLYASVDDLGSAGWDQYYGYGRVNAGYAFDSSYNPSYQYARITYPDNYQIFGGEIAIRGVVFASSFSHYIIETGYTLTPTLWGTEGITLTNGGNQEILEGKLGSWDTQDVPEGTWTIRLTVYSTTGDSMSTSVYVQTNNILETNFPLKTWHGSGARMGGQGIHTLVEDINSDGYKEIMFTGQTTGPLYAVNYRGEILPGWPVSPTSGGAAYPAAANNLVVAGYYGDEIAAYNASGETVWEIESDNFVGAPPSIGRLSGGDIWGVFLEEQNSRFNGYDLYSGSALPGWPTYYIGHSQEFHTGALVDIDDDGEIEIITASGNTTAGMDVYALNGNGSIAWSLHFDRGEVHTFPTVGDVDGDGAIEIVIISTQPASPYANIVNILNTSGQIERMWFMSGTIGWGTAPALADLNNDRIPEIIIQSETHINVTDGFGQSLPGWPVALTGTHLGLQNSSPVVGDVDGDSLMEIVFTYTDSYYSDDYVHVLNHDGSSVSAFPMMLAIGSSAVPAISDIDQDGRNEILITGSFWNGHSGYYDQLWAFDLNRDQDYVTHGRVEWGQFCHDAQHTCRYEPAPESDVDLILTLEDRDDPTYTGERLTYAMGVINYGSDVASNATLYLDLDQSVTLEYIDEHGNTCGLNVLGDVQCTFGDMAPGETALIAVHVIPDHEGGDRTITATASVSSLEIDANPSDNVIIEDTQVILSVDLSAPEFVFPVDGQIIEYEKNYHFLLETRPDAISYEFSFIQDAQTIHIEHDDDGDFEMMPSHSAYNDLDIGYLMLKVRVHLESGFWTDYQQIIIVLGDYSDLTPPVFLQPSDGDTVGETKMFIVDKILASRKYIWGFYKEGEIVPSYEVLTDEPSFEITFNDHGFESGEQVTVTCRGLIGGEWTEESEIVVILN